MANTHYIGKQRVLVQAPTTMNGQAIQSEVHRICQEDLFPSIEKVFDGFTQDGEYLEVPQLEIDIGVLLGTLDRKDFLAKTTAALDTALRELLSKEAKTYKKISTQEGRFGGWLDFLQSGQLPRYVREQGEPVIQETSLQYLASDQQAVSRLQETLLREPQSLHRLILQHSSEFLLQLLQACAGQSFRELPAQFQEIRSFFKLIQGKNLGQLPIREEQIKRLGTRLGLWEVYFQLYLRRRDKPTFPAWVQALLAKLERQRGELLSHLKKTLKLFTAERQLVPRVWDALTRMEDAVQEKTETGPIPAPNSRKQRYFERYLKTKENGVEGTTEQGALRTSSNKENLIQEEGLYIEQAGLILIHLFLVPFFKNLKLLEGQQFKDQQARARAAHLLHYVATKQEHAPEYEMAFPKFLCGIPQEEALDRNLRLTDAEKHEAEELLKAVIKNWGIIKNNSPDALREGFFAREGKIMPHDLGWKLKVEYKSIDILLTKLSWNLGVAKLPWLQGLITIEWAK